MDKNSSLYKTVLLGAVSACAGLLLSAVNAVTEPVISANSLKQVEATLEQFFPNGTFTDVTSDYVTDETDLIDGIYEADGEGYVFTLHNTGYSSDGFKFAIAFDNDGNIVGYEGLENSETAGKGDKAFKDDYKNEVIGLTSTDSMPLISGATVTTKAVGAAVTEAETVYNEIVGIDFDADAAKESAESAEPESDASCTDNGDGTYACKASGFAGELTATIEVEDGKVKAVTDLSGDDNGDGIGDDWFKDTTDLEGVSSAEEIDAISGATFTSNGVKNMIQAALDMASGETSTASTTTETSTEEENSVCTDNGDGTFACKAKGFAGELTATIEVKDGKVVSVKDLDGDDNGDSVGDDWFKDTSDLEGVSSADEIDGLSGATYTTKAVKTMIEAALAASK
jgi:uncharacterized protein with FMN-binding domain